MNSSSTPQPRWPSAWGALAGLIAALGMIWSMALLRRHLGVASPTEMIFDRMFPIITIDQFLNSLQLAGGYTPLKLKGVAAALTGHALVGIVLGAAYGWLRGRDAAAGPGHGRAARFLTWALALLWVATIVLLWPQFTTQYRGWPAPWSEITNAFALVLVYGGFGLAVAWIHALLCPRPRQVFDAATAQPVGAEPAGVGRRAFLATGVGAVFAVGLTASLRGLYRMGTFFYDGTDYKGPRVQKIVPNQEFYVVSKNLVDPVIAASEWTLTIGGAVAQEKSFTLADLRALPAQVQETTLLCISYGVGGGLASNAVWTGVSLPALLQPLGPHADVSTLLFRAADGYFETFPYSKAQEATTLLAYEMNHSPIPERHGFPVRLIVPGLYGEKSAKWITHLELVSASDPRLQDPRGFGFYKHQGWGPNFTVPIHSRFDAPLVTDDRFAAPFRVGQPAELRGMAFSGDQGISRVELSTDGGGTWQDVEIHEPGTKISWSLWRHTWRPDRAGETKLLVRATDGAGRPQISVPRNTTPQGSLGIHTVTAVIAA